MEYIIGLLVALLGGLFYYKRKYDDAAVEGRLAKRKGQDKVLAEEQKDVEDAIKIIDEAVEKLREKRKADREKDRNLTLKERADRIKKGLKND